MGVFTRQHPEREALFEYAEQIESGNPAAFGSETGAHLRECTTCSGEVREMRRSLAFTESVKTLEPTQALQASVILAMKSQRMEDRRRARMRALKSAAFAAGFMLVLGAAIQTTPGSVSSRKGVVRLGPDATSGGSPMTIETLRQPTPEEQLLEPALSAAYWRPENRWEESQQRALQAMDADIDEALAALQSNPALVRAGAAIHSSRDRKRETLKSLYAQRSL
jgi:hypothetical protein